MDTVTLPVDLAALYALLASPVFAGAFLTWFIGHLPPIENEERANWLKFILAVVVCLIWAFFVSFFKAGGFPTAASGWYAIIVLGLGIALGNQAFYQIWTAIPALRDFILQLFGRPALVTTITSGNGVVVTSAQATVSDGAAG